LEVLPNPLEGNVDLKQINESFWECVHRKTHFVENYARLFLAQISRRSEMPTHHLSTDVQSVNIKWTDKERLTDVKAIEGVNTC
jgi:hypothetical protein